jgi:NAD(P)-dependent dehydrogenase (short-subunit alcohol dehydrogenase family)
MSRLDGKAALVTGAGRGIGRGVALALARAGATVAIVDIDAAACDAVARHCSAIAPDSGVALPCDVSSRADVRAAIDRFVARAGGLDVVVNNAVHFHYAPLAEMPADAIDRMIDVGLKGALWVTQAAIPHLVGRGGGCVVNLSSAAVAFGIRNAAVYTSIKGALDALTRQQAVELGPPAIRVNAIAPGPVETPGASSVIDAAGWEARRARTPIRRLATTDDIGAAVVYLAGDDARSITGVTLRIDGGITIVGP